MVKQFLLKTFLIINTLISQNAWSNDFKKPSPQVFKKFLTKEQNHCTQEKATEAPLKNNYRNNHAEGIYVDIVSSEPLFSSLDKIDSGKGWLSFVKPIHVSNNDLNPSKKSYCINSSSLKLIPLNELTKNGLEDYLFSFEKKMKWESIVIAGGCFWGVEELMHRQKGVIATDVGYAGGKVKNATYDDVKTGTSGHAEAVRVLFDPKVTSAENLLLYFFKIHDPTTLNRQGNDIGDQYRSVIFYNDETQKKLALKVIDRVDRSKKWGAKVVTKLQARNEYYPAEINHQDYLKKNPGGYTCHFPRKFDF